MDTSLDGERLITQFRDKMLLNRFEILNNYAKQTVEKGEMYYIYDKNSNMENGYNICVCDEEKSHIVIEANSNELPDGAKVGSVLRKYENTYVLDEEATEYVTAKLENLKSNILEEQEEFLKSKRIEGHEYELSETDEDSVWLFDITENGNEAFEEIDFPVELLQNSQEGDLFVYKEGRYCNIIG